MKSAADDDSQFKLDSLRSPEPVCDVDRSSKTGSSIEKMAELTGRKNSQCSIAVVKFRQHECNNQSLKNRK